jgi:hypothetical protein
MKKWVLLLWPVLIVGHAFAQPSSATWPETNGWSIRRVDNICIIQRSLIQHLPSPAFNQEKFGFAFDPRDEWLSYSSVGLFFKRRPGDAPEAVIYVDGKLVAEMNVIHVEKPDPDSNFLKSRRDSFHEATDLAVITQNDGEVVLDALSRG